MRVLIRSLIAGLTIVAGAAAGDLRIEYMSAGLTAVKVDEHARLHFVWHTGRLPYDENDISPMRQTLDAYDSHSSVIWLTKSEVSGLEQWVERNGILELNSQYPEPEQSTYGAAFHSSLDVELDGQNHSLEWTGDTRTPEALHTAINELVRMCHEIQRHREGN